MQRGCATLFIPGCLPSCMSLPIQARAICLFTLHMLGRRLTYIMNSVGLDFCSPQLPEPLILFRYYNDFIGLAKESQAVIVEELEAARRIPAPEVPTTTTLPSSPPPPPQVSVELNRVLFKIKDLLRQLPATYYKTLQFLIEHLHR